MSEETKKFTCHITITNEDQPDQTEHLSMKGHTAMTAVALTALTYMEGKKPNEGYPYCGGKPTHNLD